MSCNVTEQFIKLVGTLNSTHKNYTVNILQHNRLDRLKIE